MTAQHLSRPQLVALMLTAAVMVALGAAACMGRGAGLNPEISSAPTAATPQNDAGMPHATPTAEEVASASSPTTEEGVAAAPSATATNPAVGTPTSTATSVASYRVTYKVYSGADRITVKYVDAQGEVEQKEVKTGWTYKFAGKPGQRVYVSVTGEPKGGRSEKMIIVRCQLLVDGRPVNSSDAGGKEARETWCSSMLPER